MSKIQFNDLFPVGLNLFSDSETFLRDLSDDEIDARGGLLFLIVFLAASPGFAINNAIIANQDQTVCRMPY